MCDGWGVVRCRVWWLFSGRELCPCCVSSSLQTCRVSDYLCCLFLFSYFFYHVYEFLKLLRFGVGEFFHKLVTISVAAYILLL